MDATDAANQTAQRVGSTFGTGLQQARRGIGRGGRAGAELTRQSLARVEQHLAEQGTSLNELPELLARRTTGLSRKQLGKRSKKARKHFDRRARQARKQLETAIHQARTQLSAALEPAPARRTRWWPWLLLAAAGIAVAAMASRQQQAPPETMEPEDNTSTDEHTEETGQRPTPR